MMEKVLYLMGDEDSRNRWGYRSVDNLGGGLTPFGKDDFMKMLQAVFA